MPLQLMTLAFLCPAHAHKEGARPLESRALSPVMVNCVRRSNALLGYTDSLAYGDCMLRNNNLWQVLKDKAYAALVGAAIMAPSLFQRFLPQPGEGPSRATMDAGWLVVHARGTMRHTGSGQETVLESMFTFSEDVTYLSTARFLVETGRLLLEKPPGGGGAAGVTTPAAGLGSSIVERLVAETGAKFELKEGVQVKSSL